MGVVYLIDILTQSSDATSLSPLSDQRSRLAQGQLPMTIVNQRDMVKGLDQMVAASPGQENTLDSGHSTLDSHHSRGGEGQ